jgi:hypothetical protein
LLDALRVPNAVKYVVVTGKCDTGERARSFNIEAGYPSEPPFLQTLTAWAEMPVLEDPRFHDAYDLFCLRRLLEKVDAFECALLLRTESDWTDAWPALMAKLRGQPFLTCHDSAGADPAGVLFNLAQPGASRFLDAAWQLFSTGAVYGMSPYSLDSALKEAADALLLEQRIAEQL